MSRRMVRLAKAHVASGEAELEELGRQLAKLEEGTEEWRDLEAEMLGVLQSVLRASAAIDDAVDAERERDW